MKLSAIRSAIVELKAAAPNDGPSALQMTEAYELFRPLGILALRKAQTRRPRKGQTWADRTPDIDEAYDVPIDEALEVLAKLREIFDRDIQPL
jgi:hypothetical protein